MRYDGVRWGRVRCSGVVCDEERTEKKWISVCACDCII